MTAVGIITPGRRNASVLPPAARAAFDRLRRVTHADRLATLLGVGEYTVVALEDGGAAQPKTIARVVAALERIGAV